MLDWGRDAARTLDLADTREWLCPNGIGGFASGTLGGALTRRYHGLLVAALDPPLGRTLLVARLDETVDYDGGTWALGATRWAGGAIDPRGHETIERFRLEGTVPVWTHACADALVERRVWMEAGANTTYVRYVALRARRPVELTVKALVNYRDYHGSTHAGGFTLGVDRVEHGVRIRAHDGARPFVVLGPGATVEPVHTWYTGYQLAAEAERGLDDREDHLHAATLRVTLAPGAAFTVVLSAEEAPGLDGEGALAARTARDQAVVEQWRKARPGTALAPWWVERLVLAADQFVVARTVAGEPGVSVIAGYHWFGDWGRDTMIALPGLTLATGRPDLARLILRSWARFVDRGMLPNRFPDSGEAPEYNTVDATLWYVEAIRAYVEATADTGTLAALYPVVEEIIRWHHDGTRYGIAVDPADGLLRAGEPGVQLTWMDAKVGDWVVTPRIGKPVEVNALWYNALVAMAGFARRLGHPAEPWEARAARVRSGFARFWNAAAGACHDVIDGPGGDDPSLRPNQILAVALPASPLGPDQQRAVVDVCARHLLTSYGLRSLDPGDRRYRGRYAGGPVDRDGAYHQGTVWAWLLGPFALAHHRVHGDRAAALAFLEPMAHHLGDAGLGTIGEILDGDAPHAPRGCVAQAWSVAETLRAWTALTEDAAPS